MTQFISRILAILMTLVSILMPAKPDNVEVTVKDMTTESACITFTCVNNTGRRMDRPEIKMIEKNVDGEWEEVQTGYFMTEIAYYVNPGFSCTESVELCNLDEDFNVIYTHLEPGVYRLTVKYGVLNIREELQNDEASCIFTVTQAE